MPLVPGQRLQAIRSAINRNANHDNGEHYGRRRTTFFCVVVHSMNDPGIFADRLNDGPGRCSAFYAVTMLGGEKINAWQSAKWKSFVGCGASRVPSLDRCLNR